MLNNLSLMGRLVKAPELRYTDVTQTAVLRFAVACDRPIKSGEEKTADFIDCIAFGKTAEFIEKHFNKGDSIIITGRIQTANWKDKDGNYRKTTEALVNTVDFAGSRKKNETELNESEQIEGFNRLNDNDIPF